MALKKDLAVLNESRRKKARKSDPSAAQPLKTKMLGALTVGVSLGCVAGISITIAAAKILPSVTENLGVWHSWIYYLVFLGAIAWAFLRGTARSAVELQLLAAACTLAIPLASLTGAFIPGIGWNAGGYTSIVDVTALVGACLLIYTATKTRSRIRKSPVDSIWHAGVAQA